MSNDKVEYTDIIVEKKYPLGYVILNRPERRNSMTTFKGGTYTQLTQAFREMKDDPEIRVFQITGTGDNFCSGNDMAGYDKLYWKPREWGPAKGREKEVWASITMKADPIENVESMFPMPNWWDVLWNNPKPSVALVRSFCLGWGLGMINTCDIVNATPDAVFAYPPIRYGASIVPQILPTWIMGYRRSMDMCLTGRFITAQDAYDSGLITRIVPDDKIEEETRKTMESIAKVPPVTNYFSKLTVHNYWENQGIQEWYMFGLMTCLITEQSSVPGHYWDFFDLVRAHGFTQAYKMQREKWGYPDPVLDAEVVRLKAKREARGEKK